MKNAAEQEVKCRISSEEVDSIHVLTKLSNLRNTDGRILAESWR